MKRVHLIIAGDVIGVGFRSWARQQAQALGLVGWVANRSDDAVEIVVEGPKEKLDKLVMRCQHGPEVAWVEKVEVTWEQATGEFLSFEVII